MPLYTQWEDIHLNLRMLQYPDNWLERFVWQHYLTVSNRKDIKFFDVGCGKGASTWYLAREGFSVAAIDGSAVAVGWLKSRLKKENLEACVMCGDIEELQLKEEYFDCIVDVSSLCYISGEKIGSVMKELFKVLKPGGRFFSTAPTQSCTKYYFNLKVEEVELNARFQTRDDVKDNFKDFSSIEISTYSYDFDKSPIELWVISAVK